MKTLLLNFPPTPKLTRRERVTYMLMAEGLPNKYVAAAMQLSISTVKKYVAAVYRKMGFRHRGEAVAWVWGEYERGSGIQEERL